MADGPIHGWRLGIPTTEQVEGPPGIISPTTKHVCTLRVGYSNHLHARVEDIFRNRSGLRLSTHSETARHRRLILDNGKETLRMISRRAKERRMSSTTCETYEIIHRRSSATCRNTEYQHVERKEREKKRVSFPILVHYYYQQSIMFLVFTCQSWCTS